MQGKHAPHGTQENLWDLRSVFEAQGKKWIEAGSPEPRLCGQHAPISSTTSEGRRDPSYCLLGLAEVVVGVPLGARSSQRQEHQDLGDRRSVQGADISVVKPHLSVGRMGFDDLPIFRALGRG
jgi:hypothetical protein